MKLQDNQRTWNSIEFHSIAKQQKRSSEGCELIAFFDEKIKRDTYAGYAGVAKSARIAKGSRYLDVQHECYHFLLCEHYFIC